jgi:transposase
MHPTKFVGLDVHKDSIAVSVADGSGGEVRFVGPIENTHAALRNLVRRLAPQGEPLQFAFEAGPTGYGIYHYLVALGCACMVVAPSLIPKKPGDQVKTDRRDANQLARLLRAKELTAVNVPGAQQEALRDLTRGREDAKLMQIKARQHVSSMLLRYSRRYPGKSHWTKQYRRWLSELVWEHAPTRVIFEDYVRSVDEATERVERLTHALEEAVLVHPDRRLIEALQALRSISLITATTLVAEVGDLTRFDHPRQLMSFIGLVPREHSSGPSIRRGGITKTGNRHVRRVLIEAAWNYRFPARVSRDILERQKGLPQHINGISFKAQERLCRRFIQMTRRGKNPRVVVTAIAREILGFSWSIAMALKQGAVTPEKPLCQEVAMAHA